MDLSTLQPKWHITFDGPLLHQFNKFGGLADKSDETIEKGHGLVTSAGAASSTRAPASDATLALLGDATLVTTAGSYCQSFSLATGSLSCKLGHTEEWEPAEP
jgi:hypothetical protein